ncbi:competence type IV pilus minor pilin ComGF [Jeotgalibacillus salarius]|uniref:Prepilin-type N-terminal cleavage/methylation domain-containing protein n=1 Tax=Jeotgalibacillus salarius TaxID=546023 RepID=A0A4Y8LAM8_9BACL|nr:competence type IV pilus minor pilin ComGF [Jeotgalibacillus salarius]TFD97556.1 prepilin-type N-terminal cleavage/methylation domain-containing protein [Jeotgalibacillus salarius]
MKIASGYVFRNNNKGFTMLEIMISIGILTVIAPLFALLIFSFASLLHYENPSKEWDVFAIQFQNEIGPLTIESHTQQSLTFTRGEAIIRFSKYGTLLRKTVNGTGHEIHLTDIKDLMIWTDNQLVMMEVEFADGIKRKTVFYTSIQE